MPPLTVAVLCISEHNEAGLIGDADGLVHQLVGEGHILAALCFIEDEDEAIRRQVQDWIDDGTIDVILTLDRSLVSAGETPPSISLALDGSGTAVYSTLVHNAEFGHVGLVDIKSARAMIASGED